MVKILLGMRMDRRSMKELTRMGQVFQQNVGMKMGMNVMNVVKFGGKVVNRLQIYTSTPTQRDRI